MTPELQSMLQDERDTVLLYDYLAPMNPTLRDDYEMREWVKIAWELLAVAAMLAVPFLLVCISGAGK